MNKNKKKFLEVYKQKACNVKESCEAFGISRYCFYKWIKADVEFLAAVEDVKEGLVDFAESCLLKTMRDGNVTAIIFFLTNRASDRWKHKNEQVHSGEIGFDGKLNLDEKFSKHLESVLSKLGGQVQG